MVKRAAPGIRRGDGRDSVIAALVFNAALIGLPFAGASLYRSATVPDVIDYAPTPASVRRTQQALAAEAARFAPAAYADRKQAWNDLIAREMAEGDAAAARGFALNAYALLGGGDAAKVRRQVRPGEGDRGLLLAVLPMIEPVHTRQRFRALVGGGGGAFDNLGDAREIAATAERWLAGEQVDQFFFALGGLTLPAAGAPTDDVRLGAAVLKIAKNGALLSPAFAATMEARVAAAAPPHRLQAELAAAFENRAAIVDEGAAATLAFARARDRDAYAGLARDLAHIGAAARAATPAGAALLLGQVRDTRDLRRLELLAVATGERAVAVAKRSPSGLVLRSAKGAIRWSERLVSDLVSVVLATLGLLIATHLAVMNALRREWEGAPPDPAPHPITKADAQRRARELESA